MHPRTIGCSFPAGRCNDKSFVICYLMARQAGIEPATLGLEVFRPVKCDVRRWCRDVRQRQVEQKLPGVRKRVHERQAGLVGARRDVGHEVVQRPAQWLAGDKEEIGVVKNISACGSTLETWPEIWMLPVLTRVTLTWL